MKKLVNLLTFTILLSLLPTVLSGQKGDFAGTWKLDRTKTVISSQWPLLVRLKIEFRGDTLLTERLYETGDGQQYPFNEKVSLDNKEYNMFIYDMPRKIKAVLTDNGTTLIFDAATTFSGSSGTEDFISKETWKADKTSKTLTIGYQNKVSSGDSSGSLFYNKE